MSQKDYYTQLGVARSADQEALKKAFRKLAREHHPDKNKGNKQSEERFKEINEAYETLSDPEKRKLYDRFGSNYRQYAQGGAPPPGGDTGTWSPFGGARRRSNPADDPDLSDLFGGMFNGQQSVRQPRDFEQAVEITVEEAFAGTTRVLQKSGQNDIEVKIPRGARTGTKVRVKGQGGKNARGQAGDLYLVIEIKPHPVYEVKGDDIYRDTQIDAFAAMLGGEHAVETLAGPVFVKIPAGASSGKLVRLRGRGLPKLNTPSESGDLYLRIMINVPADLNDDERRMIEQIARSRGLAIP